MLTKKINRIEKRIIHLWIRVLSVVFLFCFSLFGCNASNPLKLSEGHLGVSKKSNSEIPVVVLKAPFLPPPRFVEKQETYTVVVNDVPVKELLFALARDAKLNIDIHPKINGKATLNVLKQTLPQILSRIAEQVNIRFRVEGKNLIISPDTPYVRTYQVDYLNISRNSVSEVSVATEISTSGGSVKESTGESGNKSRTTVINKSENNFWESLTGNILLLLDENKNNKSERKVVVSPLGGVMSVLATEREHIRIKSFLKKILSNVRRQVLIEATIVEVELSDRYQAGVDWARLSRMNGADSNGPSIQSLMTGGSLGSAPLFSLGYNNSERGISATIKLLATFGNTKVLSSPKIMAVNNQTALLKVVNEVVYFTVQREFVDATTTSPSRETFTSKIHTVPVGLIMSVMPQISGNNMVSMSVRPTISRITGFKVDPAPRLAGAAFDNLIPEIQVREMESLLNVRSGQTVILGGLMQNKINTDKSSVPFFGDLPLIGGLFNYQDNEMIKTELVIFLRPTVIHNGSLAGDFKDFRKYLPGVEEKSKVGRLDFSLDTINKGPI